ncbi:phosphopantetheine-binding protein [Lachnospiraceae bacterium 42-17]|jgi:D-alanine--poly(phosphoribitol) ligase subunit 2
MRETILEILSESNAKIRINADKNLLEERLIDSFEIVNIVMKLEDAFHIEINPELIVSANFQTVDSIVKLVQDIVEKENGEI